MEVELMVTKRDDRPTTDQPTAICLRKVGRQSFAIATKSSFIKTLNPFFAICSKFSFLTSPEASYASLKLWPSVSLTRVSWLEKTPPTAFCILPNFFLILFNKKNYSIILEEFRQLCAIFHKFAMKISGEIICQSWPLFTPFFNFPIVHWWLLIVWWE